jgi:hypothetical protein
MLASASRSFRFDYAFAPVYNAAHDCFMPTKFRKTLTLVLCSAGNAVREVLEALTATKLPTQTVIASIGQSTGAVSLGTAHPRKLASSRLGARSTCSLFSRILLLGICWTQIALIPARTGAVNLTFHSGQVPACERAVAPASERFFRTTRRARYTLCARPRATKETLWLQDSTLNYCLDCKAAARSRGLGLKHAKRSGNRCKRQNPSRLVC